MTLQKFEQKIHELVGISKAKKKAIAIGVSGKVNEREFPMVEYDGVQFHEAVGHGMLLQKLFNLNCFAVFQTRNGYHLRFYFDNDLPHEKIVKIIRASKTNGAYAAIAEKNYCINRVSGKHKKKDLKFLGFYGWMKDQGTRKWEIGQSLFRLHIALEGLKVRKELLLKE